MAELQPRTQALTSAGAGSRGESLGTKLAELYLKLLSTPSSLALVRYVFFTPKRGLAEKTIALGKTRV
jgi:hypothetical protein